MDAEWFRKAIHAGMPTNQIAEIYIKLENAFLDRLIEKMAGQTKDCSCVTHEGPHFIYWQRTQISLNSGIIRRGGLLVVHAFSLHEASRLRELGDEMKNRGCE